MSQSFSQLARPTILQIVPTLNIGGAERTTIDIARAIVANGGRALVASSGGRMIPELLAVGGEHIDLEVKSKNPIIMALNVEHLTRLITREKVDLVHARSRAPAWSALAAARRTARPFVTTYHSKVHEAPRLKVFYNSVMARGDAVIANSAYTAERIARVHRPDAARVFTVPRGIDVDHFALAQIAPERIANLRAQWGVTGDDRPIFMLPARLTRWKGQTLAVEAAAALKSAGHANFELLLVGDAQGRDDYVNELEGMIARLGLDAHVRLTGPCNDMPAAYAIADIVLSPSIEAEPFGRTAVEAQSCERVIVASDSGGQRETVLAATGYLFASNNVHALTATMTSALTLSPDERKAMGARGRINVTENFSLTAMADATLAIYAKLLSPAHD